MACSTSATADAGHPLQGSGFRVQGSGFGVQGSGFRVQGSGFRVQGSGFRIQGSGVRIWGVWLWFKVQDVGSGIRVEGFAPPPPFRTVHPEARRAGVRVFSVCAFFFLERVGRCTRNVINKRCRLPQTKPRDQ